MSDPLRSLRRVGAAALTLEAIVVLFGIAPLYSLGRASGAKVGALAAVAMLLIVAAGTQRRRWGPALGTAVQVPVIATGAISAPLYFLGVIFAGLWVGYLAMARSVARQLGR